MKKSIHPKEYKPVIFSDAAANFSFLTRSTAHSDETIKWTDGQSYPLIKIQISSASHPFYTGEEKVIDTEGRIDRFKSRTQKAATLKSTRGNKITKAAKESIKKRQKAAASATKTQ
jgi:large subunit ribosomal protein L31